MDSTYKSILAALICILLITPVFASVTGISQADITVQNDDTFNSAAGKKWVLDWTGTGSDKISGGYNSQELNQKIAGTGTSTTDSFSIEMASTNSFVTANFQGRINPDLWTMKIATGTEWFTDLPGGKTYDQLLEETKTQLSNEICPNNRFGYITNQKGGAGLYKVYMVCAVKETNYGTVNEIGNVRKIFNTNWKFDTGSGEPVTLTLTNQNNVQAGASTEIPGKLKILWEGSLDSGYVPPSTSTVYGVQSNQYGWKIIDRRNHQSYIEYIATADSGLQKSMREIISYIMSNDGGTTRQDIPSLTTSLESAIKSRVNAALTPTTNVEWKPAIANTDGTVRLDVSETVTIPRFRMLLSADWLKLTVQSGKPEIQEPLPSLKILELNSYADIPITMKNTGDAPGYYSLKVNCQGSSFTANPTLIQQVLISAKSQVTKSVRISFGSISSTEKSVKSTCDVKMMDENVNSLFDTSSFGVEGSQRSECVAGTKRPVYNNDLGQWQILQCNDDELTEKVVDTCPVGWIVKYVNGDYKCVGGVIPPCVGAGCGPITSCEWYDVVCRFKSHIEAIVVAFIASLIIIGATMYAWFKEKRSKKKKVYEVLANVEAMVLLFVIVWLMYSFYVALLGVIIWLVLWMAWKIFRSTYLRRLL